MTRCWRRRRRGSKKKKIPSSISSRSSSGRRVDIGSWPRRRGSWPRRRPRGSAARRAQLDAVDAATRAINPAQARIKAEAEAKAAEERRLAREAEDETNGADPERVYCGVRLVGRLSSMMSGDRPLPPQFKCGVCQTANAAEAIRCSSCSAARVAPWQRLPGGLLRAGTVIKANDYEGVFAIISSVGRMQKRMKVVLFAPEASPEVGDLMLPAIEAEWTVCSASEANDAIQQHMLCWALCPKCEHVFYVQNGDIANREVPRGHASLVIIVLTGRLFTGHVRAKELPKVKLQKEADEKLLRETEARKAELKTQEPLPTKEILACTAEIKRLRVAIRASKIRGAPVQDWCPRCLNREFDFFPKDVWPTP